MERKIADTLEAWKESDRDKALMICGGRQTGKTYSARELGKGFASFIELNLEDNPSQRKIFEGDVSAGDILERLSFIPEARIIPGDTLLFIDEIQACPAAVSSLKSLAQCKDIRVIASGSLLGVRISPNPVKSGGAGSQRLSPAGYVDIVEMHPMDFEEFMWAMGVSHKATEAIRRHVREGDPLDPYTLDRATELYRRYLVVGGMPEAVSTYAETRDYGEVLRALGGIRAMLYRDISKYSDGLDVLLMQTCLESVPSQLAGESKRFVYLDIENKPGKGKREYKKYIQWLNGSNAILLCWSLREPRAPLNLQENRDLFKAYMSDTGMLSLFLGPDAAPAVMKDIQANNGAFMENAVCCELRRLGYVPRYYSSADGRMEIDFVVSDGRGVMAVEVKSGRGTASASLRKAGKLKDLGITRRIKLAEGNIETEKDGTIRMPLFSVCFLEPPAPADIEPIDLGWLAEGPGARSAYGVRSENRCVCLLMNDSILS